MKRLPVLALTFLVVSCVRLESQTRNDFLWVSDVHFDPTPYTGLTDALVKTSVDQWTNILPPSPYSQDTRWPLFATALTGMHKTAPGVPFMIITGDVLVHDFREKFDQTASEHRDEAFEQFVKKTFDFVANELQTAVPGKPILYTLGNNDDTCGDYHLQPDGPFLRDTTDAVMRMLGPLADGGARADWAALGSYSVQHPILKGVRVIAVNSIFFSAKYKDTCGTDADGDPGSKEMTWLRSKLADAKANGEKVWLFYHIAPGIDGYATARAHAANPDNPIVEMWKREYTDAFAKLLDEYRDVVTVNLAGHEHMDDFRLIDHSLILLAPGLSPYVNQNPAFRVVSFTDKADLRDATTYYLSNLGDMGLQNAEWKSEYSFGQRWHMKRLDHASFEKLFGEVESNPIQRAAWTMFYGVSRPAGKAITPESFPYLFCAAGNVDDAGFQTCVNRVQKAQAQVARP
jgi:hypothetical protein